MEKYSEPHPYHTYHSNRVPGRLALWSSSHKQFLDGHSSNYGTRWNKPPLEVILLKALYWNTQGNEAKYPT